MLKRLFVGLMLAAGLLLLAPAPEASASDSGWYSSHETSGDGWFRRLLRRLREYHRQNYGQQEGPLSAPELDPGAGGSALVLLIGGAAYIVSRRREDDAA